MMHHRLRRLMRDERGHAIVLGSVGLLIMALVVMASVSLGNGVYEKIKLQDAADAQAYSTAVKAARAYNFFAYTNRAMVVHYNALLTFMAILAHAQYLKNTLGRICGILGNIPILAALKVIEAFLKNIWYPLWDYFNQFGAWVLWGLNAALWFMQEWMLSTTYVDSWAGSTANSFVRKTDRHANLDLMSRTILSSDRVPWVHTIGHENGADFLHMVSGALQGYNFSPDDTGFAVRGAMFSPLNDLRIPHYAVYRLLMGNIVNGERRPWTAFGGYAVLGGAFNITMFLLGSFTVTIWPWRLTKHAGAELKNVETRDVRDQLWADNSFRIEQFTIVKGRPQWKTVFGYSNEVAADYSGGFHMECLGKCTGKQDRHHKFLGIVPFVLSRPAWWKPRSVHFNQPCNVAIASYRIAENPQVFETKLRFLEGLGKLDESGKLDMTWGSRAQGTSAVVDNNFTQETGGMLALATGRAVYHRPGDWQEEPNFFNPFWVARLTPVLTHWQAMEIGAALKMTNIELFQSAIFH